MLVRTVRLVVTARAGDLVGGAVGALPRLPVRPRRGTCAHAHARAIIHVGGRIVVGRVTCVGTASHSDGRMELIEVIFVDLPPFGARGRIRKLLVASPRLIAMAIDEKGASHLGRATVGTLGKGGRVSQVGICGLALDPRSNQHKERRRRMRRRRWRQRRWRWRSWWQWRRRRRRRTREIEARRVGELVKVVLVADKAFCAGCTRGVLVVAAACLP
mmetsp:Transcript_28579/g.73317  ORF Transcript_28579/g.73317 Transcript_28579/m.73317 type:complete len:216 (-) Transcript_28579:217-864(-)